MDKARAVTVAKRPLNESRSIGRLLAKTAGWAICVGKTLMASRSGTSLRPIEQEGPGGNDVANRWGWLVALLIFAAALRALFLAGPVGSDDTRYMDAAWKLASGQPAGVIDHAYVRAAFIAWLALWLSAGVGAGGLVLSQLMLGTALVATVYWLGAKLADERTGLLAALCWTLFPIELVYGGIVFPDQLALLLATFGGGLAVDGLRAEQSGARGYLIGAGVLSGLAVSAKEPYGLLPIIFGLWALWRVRPYKVAMARSVAIGAIAVCTFALEYPFFRLWTGDWFYRHRALAAGYGVHGLGADLTGSRLHAVAYYPLEVLANPAVCGFFGWLIFIAATRGLQKIKEPAFVMIWSLCFFLFLQYGSADPRHYLPVPKQARYVHPLVVMLFIPLGRWLVEVAASAPFRRLLTLLFIACVGLQAAVAANNRAAEGLYTAGIPRSVESAIAMRAGGTIDRVALPEAVKDRIPFDLRQKTADWPTVDLSRGLRPEDAHRLRESRTALLIPGDLLKLSSGDPALQNMLQWLALHADGRPVQDLRSPVDRIYASLPMLERLAKRVEIGRLYLLHN